MTDFSDVEEPEHDDRADHVLAFWEAARGTIGTWGFGSAGAVVGLTWSDAVPPPAWAFGGPDDAELADELLELVLAGTKTGTSSSLWEYEDEEEPLPQKGELSIVLDSAGEPRAIIRTTAVEVVPFDQVGEEFAHSEGEGDRTLAYWREAHESFWRRILPQAREFATDMPVVCESFELVYPR